MVPEALEGSLMLASHALVMMGVPLRRVVHRVQSARRALCGLARLLPRRQRQPGDDAEHTYVRLHSVILRDDAGSIGKRIEELELHEVGAEVTTIRRGKERLEVTPRTELQRGDVVVLRGSAEAVDRAEGRLLN
ncbi:TrkA C-terminal domain-containing protein [Massilia sp. B-10]|nr:TrkA C-terminal domain-containing protein [Massilia sp. B-10]